MNLEFQTGIKLSDYTTMGLGGKARYFISCKTNDEIVRSLQFAEANNIRVQVMSGGSNIIFPDDMFEGMVIKIDLKGVEFSEDKNAVYASVKAGVNWDHFVAACIEKSLSGVECLSGIPGSVGATPVQNVGAYGQEVKESIVTLKAIERSSLREVKFENKDCDFGYRQSRFKNQDKDKYIITEVKFRFEKNIEPEVKYSELHKLIELKRSKVTLKTLEEKLMLIRTAVLELRKGKSMIIDRSDPNSKSCGSFFLNPVLNEKSFHKFQSLVKNFSGEIPVFKSGEKYKLSAAWLVEQAGFHKGYIKGGVGISTNHSLAIININTTTEELLKFASEIEASVFDKFSIRLIREPVIV